MRIVARAKPAPDLVPGSVSGPALGAERLGPEPRLDAAVEPVVVNGSDDHARPALAAAIRPRRNG